MAIVGGMYSTESTSSSFVEIKTGDLLIGMFVYELDCSWAKTPFSPSGFHLKTADDIQMLTKFCKSVYIDISRGAQPARLKPNNLTKLSSARKASPTSTTIKVDRNYYLIKSSLKRQLDLTDKHYQQLLQDFDQLTQKIRAREKLDFQSLETSITGLIDSALANPQTLVWCLNTDLLAISSTAYCVRAAIWATLLARQIGLVRSEIESLFLGTLLADVGLHLTHQGLTERRGSFRKEEFTVYKKHVQLGVELLTQYPDIDQRVVSIARCHHERNDGLGFPKGLRGQQIPSLARFASLAYCFERILGSLCADRNTSPAKAIARLYRQRDLKFPEQLVVEFIHLMGMYPIGTLVELNTGEIAIVLEQHEEEKLSPKIAVLTSVSQEKLEKPKVIVLGAVGESRTVLSSLGPVQREIRTRDYRFSFVGKWLGFRPFGLRL
ncbi:MAG: HD-GYP domain-containing protein (c-di-GMP phosphodiesterase class II) [Pseudohongiellaceae bacterium]|jgi:HD-GYP domain-containing protein (c-di-GMP phosphodiesterase class II)